MMANASVSIRKLVIIAIRSSVTRRRHSPRTISAWRGRAIAILLNAALFLVTVTGLAQSSRPGMGSIPYADQNGTGVTFRVWAPFATNVSVRGDFNSWGQSAMTAEGNGNWSADVPSARVGHQYKYFLNGNLWKRDPRGRRVVSSSGNSVVYDSNAFNWGTNSFSTPWRNDTVIYQMHVGTFAGTTPPSTFDQAIPRLDHLKNLGVNAIKVMPVTEFPGGRSWGYNPAELFAVESSYGGPDAFKRFIRACHDRGIAVLVDVVHNHYGPNDLDLWQFDGWYQNSFGGIYFYNDNRANTPWGPRPDFGRPQVRQFIRDQIFMFLEEYRVDGFRWDSIVNIINTDLGHNPDGESLVRDINWEMQQSYPDKLRIAEDHAFDYNMNFHSQWDVGSRWALHAQVVSPSDGDRNMYTLRDLLQNWAGHQRVVFSEAHDYIARNHDRSRLPSEIDSTDPESIWARKRGLLAAGIVMSTPGIPMIFQGQELHETLAFHDDTALRWSRTNTHSGIVQAYSDLIHARRNLRGVTQGLKGTGINVHHIDDANKVLAFIRWDAGGQTDDVVVVANFSVNLWTNSIYVIPFPSPGTWYCHFNSDAQVYQSDFGNIGETQITASGSPATATVNMGMYSIQIFSKTPNDPWLMDSNGDGIPDGWYLRYGFNPSGTSIAEGDNDADGFTNRQEYWLGTNPNDPNSKLTITGVEVGSDGLAALTWRSVGGRTYRVEYSDDLATGFHQAFLVTESAVGDDVETTRTFIDDYSETGGLPPTGFRSYRIALVRE